jgi:hypothetical protein
MAKLATQTIVIQLSKAVPESEGDQLVALGTGEITQLEEAVNALAGENGIVVEVTDTND